MSIDTIIDIKYGFMDTRPEMSMDGRQNISINSGWPRMCMVLVDSK